jgi:hypothetical protein
MVNPHPLNEEPNPLITGDILLLRHQPIFNRDLGLRNDSSARLSSNRCDGGVHDIRAVLVLRRDTTDHHAIDNRDPHTIRGRALPVW